MAKMVFLENMRLQKENALLKKQNIGLKKKAEQYRKASESNKKEKEKICRDFSHLQKALNEKPILCVQEIFEGEKSKCVIYKNSVKNVDGSSKHYVGKSKQSGDGCDKRLDQKTRKFITSWLNQNQGFVVDKVSHLKSHLVTSSPLCYHLLFESGHFNLTNENIVDELQDFCKKNKYHDYIDCEVLVEFECLSSDFSEISGLMERKFLEEVDKDERLNV